MPSASRKSKRKRCVNFKKCGRYGVFARGCCEPCYRSAYRLVVDLGETTWDELEKKGKTLPAGRQGPKRTPAWEAVHKGA